MSNKSDFYKYAVGHMGLSGNTVGHYMTSVGNKMANFGLPVNGYVNPTIIEERQLNIATMDVFSRLMMDRIIFLGDAIDDDVSNILVGQLLYLSSADPGKDISIYINSPGGVVYSGLAIYDTMQYVNCDINTICTGMAASMASVLLTAGTKGKRFALPHSRVMIHQPSGSCQGQATEMEIAVEEIKKLKTELYEIISTHSGVSFEKILADADRDHWLTANESKEYGLIDDVLYKSDNE